MEIVAESGRMTGMDLVEVNPILDQETEPQSWRQNLHFPLRGSISTSGSVSVCRTFSLLDTRHSWA